MQLLIHVGIKLNHVSKRGPIYHESFPPTVKMLQNNSVKHIHISMNDELEGWYWSPLVQIAAIQSLRNLNIPRQQYWKIKIRQIIPIVITGVIFVQNNWIWMGINWWMVISKHICHCGWQIIWLGCETNWILISHFYSCRTTIQKCKFNSYH